MSIQDAVAKRKELERNLAQVVETFEKDTSLEVVELSLGHQEVLPLDSKTWERHPVVNVYVKL